MKQTYILGISGFYHDSAAVLTRDGEVVAAAQEERFTRRKHDPRFPAHAINYCLGEEFIEADELDAVVFYDNPVLTLDRVIKNVVSRAPEAGAQWKKAAINTLGVKPFLKEIIRSTLGANVPVYFTSHHASHAASAFYPSPFEKSAILTLDGVGEWATTTIGVGEGQHIRIEREITYPHSLGLLYSAFTYFCGFKVNSGEYKLMGLAPYGEPRYADVIKDKLIDIRDDGSFRLNTEYFGYLDGLTMTSGKFDELFDGPPREPEQRITLREVDLAASIQKVTEEVVLSCARYACELAESRNLVLAGGVALNCVANGILLRSGIVDGLWIQPAAGDAGGALGAALLAAHTRFSVPRKIPANGRDSQGGSYLGPSFSLDEIRAFLDRYDYPYKVIEDRNLWAKEVAGLLAQQKIVGVMNGRMEFGPRALGGRSILGDPRDPETQTTMNLKIKYRESFRPFAPSVMYDAVNSAFELDEESPYMLLVAPVKEERRQPISKSIRNSSSDDLLDIVKEARSDLPAITHVDYSARVQTVHPDDSTDYYAILEAFNEMTGCPVVVNTSFNVRGEPIICSPQDAYRCFMRTEMDALGLENVILLKSEQPISENDDSWKDDYELD
jgi:carbamoyltransferase